MFITLYSKKPTGFVKDLSRMEDQSGQVVNICFNLTQMRNMPENGFVCLQSAYKITQRLLTSLKMMYSQIKYYYQAVLSSA
jgi:hypothetical protein